MPRIRKSELTVISVLKSLSEEADRCIDEFPTESSVDAWFNAVKECFIRIRDCTSIKDITIEYPPDNSSIFGQGRSNNKITKTDTPETQIEHIHVDKNLSASRSDVDSKTETVANSKIENNFTEHKLEIISEHKNEMSQNLSQTLITTSTKVAPETTCTPNIKKLISQNASQTLNSSTKIIPKTPSTPKVKKLIELKNNTLQSGILNSVEAFRTPTRSANKILDRTIILDSDHSNKRTKLSKPIQVVKSSGVKTRSSIKRKSSVRKDESNKKQKSNEKTTTKTTHPKCAVVKTVYPKVAALENKMKVPAVIMPVVKLKMTPSQSKENLLLKEIKKKEEKAMENQKKILADRQIKAEENKKKREEKIEKIKQNRLKIQKEKQQLVMETIKTQTTKDIVKKNGMKTRIQELIDQNAKENKIEPSAPSKEKETYVNSFKTPISKMSHGDDEIKEKLKEYVNSLKTPVSKISYANDGFVNYELTPIPDSSTYNFSDDDEEKQPQKPIPSWAQSYALKCAIAIQYYNPPDTNEIFGRVIDPPDLSEIFQIQKKRYKIRTSSAIWNTPPERSLRY